MTVNKKIIGFSVLIYVMNLTGCGVLLYPERQGQERGKIDPTIAILDGIGLLLYVIPGLVAFAIDFHQGTIYLPGGVTDASGESDLRAVKVEGPMTEENIEKTLKEALNRDVDISGDQVRIQPIDDGIEGLIPAMARAAGAPATRML